MTNEFLNIFFLQEMTYFRNFNVAPYAVTPAQGPNGKLFMFFETIPQEVTFYGPALVATFTSVTVRISIPDEEEDSIILTLKGISNNVMASTTNSPRRRRHPQPLWPRLPTTPKHPGRGPWMHTRISWWLGQPSLSPTSSRHFV
jgi:hypothetical protein